MLLAVELIITLLVGFVLGRIWQIRQQILFAEHVQRRSYKSALANKESSTSDDPQSSGQRSAHLASFD
jgi:hypothetical protein